MSWLRNQPRIYWRKKNPILKCYSGYCIVFDVASHLSIVHTKVLTCVLTSTRYCGRTNRKRLSATGIVQREGFTATKWWVFWHLPSGSITPDSNSVKNTMAIDTLRVKQGYGNSKIADRVINLLTSEADQRHPCGGNNLSPFPANIFTYIHSTHTYIHS